MHILGGEGVSLNLSTHCSLECINVVLRGCV